MGVVNAWLIAVAAPIIDMTVIIVYDIPFDSNKGFVQYGTPTLDSFVTNFLLPLTDYSQIDMFDVYIVDVGDEGDPIHTKRIGLE